MDKNIKDFPEDLNKKLRIESAKKNTNIKTLIINILWSYFKQEKKS